MQESGACGQVRYWAMARMKTILFYFASRYPWWLTLMRGELIRRNLAVIVFLILAQGEMASLEGYAGLTDVVGPVNCTDHARQQC